MHLTGKVIYRGIVARGISGTGASGAVSTAGERALDAIFQRATDQAFIEAVEYWRDHFMPLHFQSGARKRYAYTPRTAGYMKRKARSKGHQKDLVWTGSSERMIIGNPQKGRIRKRNGGYGAEVPIVAPKYFFQYNPRNKFIDKPKELTQLAAAELNFLAKNIERRIGVLFDAMTRITAVERRIA